MTQAFTQTAFSNAPVRPGLPTLPSGWPIGSYASYEEAQRAVDHLADSDFPVADLTIVGVEPMLVERGAGKLSWRRVLGSAAMSGAWCGMARPFMLRVMQELMRSSIVIGPPVRALYAGKSL